MNLGLGFDTGGTYTDAVIMDLESGKIMEKAKALTTRDNLSVGIRNSIKKFNKESLKNIVMISLSSTLATNSIVEGKGCRVGLITIGRDFDKSIPVDLSTRISGGHDLSGSELETLDEKAAEDFLLSAKGRVDGIAITSYLSVRNPDHENRIKKMSHDILDVPVVCGHELSSNLGFNERTVTSIMNARLIPIIKELIESVKDVMAEYNIKVPFMIVKGDGSIMDESIAMERPIETILSGPAASLIGAKTLTGEMNAIVMDMGGTTTDIGILRNGNPRLEKEGAIIGGHRTRVLAAEISTSGIGGDSRIIVNGNKFSLSSLRVVPLCIATSKWPQLLPRLKSLADTDLKFVPESMNVNNIIQDIEFFVKLKDANLQITDADIEFLNLISEEPKSLKEAGIELDKHPLTFGISKMEEFGMIQRIGLTPTDLLHAEKSYVEYDEEASRYGVIYQAKKMNMTSEEFIEFAKNEVIDKLSEELLKKLFFEETGTMHMDTISKDLMKKSMSGEYGLDYNCSIKINKPIIGIGAPISAYFPAMAAKFDTKLLLPEHSEVGNAVGAITGSIVESVEILITPVSGESTIDDPACTVFARFGRFDFDKMSEAIPFSITKGSEFVLDNATKAGANFVDVSYEQKDKRFGIGLGQGGNVLIETLITVTAIGKPKHFKTEDCVY